MKKVFLRGIEKLFVSNCHLIKWGSWWQWHISETYLTKHLSFTFDTKMSTEKKAGNANNSSFNCCCQNQYSWNDRGNIVKMSTLAYSVALLELPRFSNNEHFFDKNIKDFRFEFRCFGTVNRDNTKRAANYWLTFEKLSIRSLHFLLKHIFSLLDRDLLFLSTCSSILTSCWGRKLITSFLKQMCIYFSLDACVISIN